MPTYVTMGKLSWLFAPLFVAAIWMLSSANAEPAHAATRCKPAAVIRHHAKHPSRHVKRARHHHKASRHHAKKHITRARCAPARRPSAKRSPAFIPPSAPSVQPASPPLVEPSPGPAPTPAPPPTSPPAPAPPTDSTPPPAAPAFQLFAPDSFWNAELPADAPLASNSDALVSELQQLVSTDETLKRGPWINTDKWSTPIYTVGADQPTVRVTLDQYNPALQQAFSAVPLPPDAKPAAGADACLTVVQPSTDKMWEFWQLRKLADGWHAMWGGEMDNVSTNPGRYPNNWGAPATSLPLIGGVMTIDELERGSIDHALSIGLPEILADWYAWPAGRTDGRSLNPLAIPEGTRFRLNPALDVDALPIPRFTKIIARAAQKYGFVVRDTSGNVTFYAQDPTPTGTNPYGAIFGDAPNNLLSVFPWGQLEALAAPLSEEAH